MIDADGTVHTGAEALAKMGEMKGGSASMLNTEAAKLAYPWMRTMRNWLVGESIEKQRAREEAESPKNNTP